MRLTGRGLEAERRICGAHDRGRGQLADGNVVGMAIRALRTERNDDLRSDPAKVTGDFLDRFGRVDLIERAIRIVEEPDFSEAQLCSGRQQLGLTRLADDVRSRRLLAVSEPTAFASGRCHQIGRHSLGRTFRQSPARSQRLIVGMGEHPHKPEVWRQSQGCPHMKLFCLLAGR